MKKFLLTVILCLALVPATALAYSVSGEWPENEKPVSISAHQLPMSVVLGKIAKAASLDLVITLPSDPLVTLDVKKRSPREVLELVLAGQPVTVERKGTLITVRPEAIAPAVTPAAAATTPTPPPAEKDPKFVGIGFPTPTSTRTGPVHGERVSFGSDVEVNADERVEAVASMGGDAKIKGEVMGDVASLGGDVELEPGAIVHGSIISMGGDIEIPAGATVEGDIVPMGGKLEIEKGAHARPAQHAQVSIGSFKFKADKDDNHDKRSGKPWSKHDDDEESWAENAVGNLTKFGLLFLFALFMLTAFPGRLEFIRDELKARPIRSGFAGWGGLLAAAVLILVLTVTIIGIPLAVVLALALPVAMLVGLTVTAVWFGALLPVPQLQARPAFGVAAGLGILFLISLLGGLGTFILLNATFFGFGALLLSLLKQHRARRDGSPPSTPTAVVV